MLTFISSSDCRLIHSVSSSTLNIALFFPFPNFPTSTHECPSSRTNIFLQISFAQPAWLFLIQVMSPHIRVFSVLTLISELNIHLLVIEHHSIRSEFRSFLKPFKSTSWSFDSP